MTTKTDESPERLPMAERWLRLREDWQKIDVGTLRMDCIREMERVVRLAHEHQFYAHYHNEE